MGKHETITAEISEAMAMTIREAVETGRYGSVSDVVAHALAEWREALPMSKISPDDVAAMVEASLDDDDEGVDAEIVFAELLAEIDEMIAADERAA